MKNVRFGIQVAVLMLAFPLLFIVGITHSPDISAPANETKAPGW